MPPVTVLGDGPLFGAFYGNRPPRVVGLHGWGRTHRDFDAVFSSMDALGVDLPGFGPSPPPPSPWGTAEYADSLASALNDLGRSFVVVGHSFGGRVALRLAERHPEVVESLVLTGAPLLRVGGRPKVSRKYRFYRALNRMGLVGSARLEKVRSRTGSADYRSASGVMRDILVRVVNEEYSDILPSVDCKVTLVWGERDGEVPVEVARRAFELFPSATLVVLEGHDHYSVLEAAEFQQVVKSALVQVDAP